LQLWRRKANGRSEDHELDRASLLLITKETLYPRPYDAESMLTHQLLAKLHRYVLQASHLTSKKIAKDNLRLDKVVIGTVELI
jgi:hypothetical protein